jgi:hypothetical protein
MEFLAVDEDEKRPEERERERERERKPWQSQLPFVRVSYVLSLIPQ